MMNLSQHLLEICRLKKASAKGKQRKEARHWESRILSLIEADASARRKRRIPTRRGAARSISNT